MEQQDYIQLDCPICGKGLNVRQEYRGRAGKCKHCGGAFTVPDGDLPASTVPDPLHVDELAPPMPRATSSPVGTTRKRGLLIATVSVTAIILLGAGILAAMYLRTNEPDYADGERYVYLTSKDSYYYYDLCPRAKSFGLNEQSKQYKESEAIQKGYTLVPQNWRDQSGAPQLEQSLKDERSNASILQLFYVPVGSLVKSPAEYMDLIITLVGKLKEERPEDFRNVIDLNDPAFRFPAGTKNRLFTLWDGQQFIFVVPLHVSGTNDGYISTATFLTSNVFAGVMRSQCGMSKDGIPIVLMELAQSITPEVKKEYFSVPVSVEQLRQRQENVNRHDKQRRQEAESARLEAFKQQQEMKQQAILNSRLETMRLAMRAGILAGMPHAAQTVFGEYQFTKTDDSTYRVDVEVDENGDGNTAVVWTAEFTIFPNGKSILNFLDKSEPYRLR